MRGFVRFHNPLKGMPTNFSGAKLSKDQIKQMNNISDAKFKGLVIVDNTSKELAGDQFFRNVAKFFKIEDKS